MSIFHDDDDPKTVTAVCVLVGIFLAFLLFGARVDAQGRTISVQSCRYGENRVDGKYACLLPATSIQTESGAIPLPEYIINGVTLLDDPLYLRTTMAGDFRMAGQSHGGLGNWEYAAGMWRIVGPSYGVNPTIYDDANRLTQGELHYGSQGLRFFGADGRLWTGDETYADPVRRIWQWTQLGNVTVGQGEHGCIALYQDQRYVLAMGFCVDVHMTRAGSSLAISYHLQAENRREFRWLVESEIPLLPAEPPTTTPPTTPIEICGNGIDDDKNGYIDENCPIAPPTQDCAFGWVSQMPHRQAVVEQLQAQFPAEWDAMNTQGDLRLIKRLAWQLHEGDPRWGLNGKRQTDVLSEDVLVYLNPTVDNGAFPGVEAVDFVIAHGSPSAYPGWLNVTCPMNQGGAGGKWIQPLPVDDTDPAPDPPDPTIPALLKRIAELEAEILGLRIDVESARSRIADLERERDELRAEVERLKSLPEPTCAVSGPGWIRNLFGISCRVVR